MNLMLFIVVLQVQKYNVLSVPQKMNIVRAAFCIIWQIYKTKPNLSYFWLWKVPAYINKKQFMEYELKSSLKSDLSNIHLQSANLTNGVMKDVLSYIKAKI